MAKKVAITLIASILVLVVCAFAVIALVHSSKARSNIPSDPGTPSLGTTSNISKLCLEATYQDSCMRTLSQISPNDSVSPADVFKTFVEVALKEFESAASRSANVTKGKTLGDDAASVPICQRYLGNSLVYLQDVLASLQGKDVNAVVVESHSMKHAISAAMTMINTCVDSFSDPTLSLQMSNVLQNATEMGSNALAVISSIASVEEELELQSDIKNLEAQGQGQGRRRLMAFDLDEQGYPTWLSAGDRKLLQAPRNSLKPNAVVAKDGSGQYRTIKEAISNMPLKLKAPDRYVIYVKAGVYQEYINITMDMTNVFMYGDGAKRTIITGSHSNGTGYKTVDSPTVNVDAASFTAKNMGFRNTAGPEEKQAVALQIQGNLGAFFNCRFEGFQDTLCVLSNRQFFRDCIITGTIDFIFGNSGAVFQNCRIYLNTPTQGQANTVTASGRTDEKMPSGIVLQNCRIKASDSRSLKINGTQSYLGRPWKDFSQVVVMETYIDRCINTQGWLEWKTGVVPPSTIYYAEYANTGPGSNTANRVKWPGFHVIGRKEALRFTSARFIQTNQWLGARGIPYDSAFSKRS